jgi:hypothetical protein
MLKMIKLLPEIQDYLASLKTRNEVWHFSAKRMGNLAALAPELQRAGFTRIRKNYVKQTEILKVAQNQAL